MSKPAQALLLDLDGTLADSLSYLFDIYSDFLKEFSKTATQEEFQTLNGVPLKIAVERLKKNHGLAPSLDELFRRYKESLDSFAGSTRPAKGAFELLEAARVNQIPVAVVTSALKLHAEAWLDEAGLSKFINLVVGGDSVSQGKPHAEPYLTAAQKLGVDPRNCIAVEDSSLGLRSALGAGTQTFLYSPQNNSEPPPGVAGIIGDLRDLISLFQNRPTFITFPLEKLGHVIISPAKTSPLSANVRSQVETLWNQTLKQKPDLHNSKIFSVHTVSGNNFEGDFVDYKSWLAQKQLPELYKDLKIEPLAVTGVLIAGNHLIFTKRSLKVFQDPGKWELGPSGGVDDSCARVGQKLNVQDQLMMELKEELGLLPSDVLSTQLLGMIYDTQNHVRDIVFRLNVGPRPNLKYGDEYTEFQAVLLTEVDKFVADRQFEVAPFTFEVLKLLRSQ